MATFLAFTVERSQVPLHALFQEQAGIRVEPPIFDKLAG